MKHIYKIFLFILLIIPFAVNAQYNDDCKITINDKEYKDILDDKFSSYEDFDKGNINISCDSTIKGIYIKYKVDVTKGTILEENIKLGENNFIHEFKELSNKNNKVTLSYDDKFSISDIYVFKSEDEIPTWVEKWELLDDADMILFSTHGDDEQLFFLGLLPKYVDAGKKIQVVYFANHNVGPYATYKRCHEQLTGLWTVGIKYYPELGYFPDQWATSFEEGVKKLGDYNFTFDDVILYNTRMIRKYKPEVIVGHDLNGEYNHGQHIVNVKGLQEAYLKAMDKTYDEESVKEYGTFEIQKFYIHLLKDNEITMDYDTPLEGFGGKTAFEVSQEGFSKHESQQWTWFHDWIYGDHNQKKKATDIKTYSPLKYGLFYSSVGEDIQKNDMFENVIIKKDNPIKEKTSEILEDIKKDVKEIKDKNSISKFLTTKSILSICTIVLVIAGIIAILLKRK